MGRKKVSAREKKISTSYSMSEGEHENEALGVYLALTSKGMSEYIRELIRGDRPNRLKEIAQLENLKRLTEKDEKKP